MTKLVGIIVLAAVVAQAYSLLVVPPSCTAGGGSSVSIFTYVTNLTLSLTELTAIEPYNLTAGVTYNVTFAFIPTSTSNVTWFNVTAALTVDDVPQQFQIASTPVPPFNATTVATALTDASLVLKLQLILACAVQNLNQLLQLELLELLNCAGDLLATQVLQNVPSQVSATVFLTVPTLANGTAIFQGIVGDAFGNVVACRQGQVNIIGQ